MKKRSKVVAKKPTASKAKASSKKMSKSAAKSSSARGPANKLLVRLAKDPKIASAIENIDHGANSEKIENFRDTVQTFMKMAKSFISSKRAVKLAAYAEVMIVAYRLGLVLKTNILDRPEVKQYLDENLEGIRESAVYKMARTFIGNAISKEADAEGEEEAAPARSAKSKWNDGVRATKSVDESEESDESEDEGPQLTRQQRRHEKERQANLSAMKNQGSSGPNRAAKRHAKAAEAEEAHSDFIPAHKASTSKNSNKNAIKQ